MVHLSRTAAMLALFGLVRANDLVCVDVTRGQVCARREDCKWLKLQKRCIDGGSCEAQSKQDCKVRPDCEYNRVIGDCVDIGTIPCNEYVKAIECKAAAPVGLDLFCFFDKAKKECRDRTCEDLKGGNTCTKYAACQYDGSTKKCSTKAAAGAPAALPTVQLKATIAGVTQSQCEKTGESVAKTVGVDKEDVTTTCVSEGRRRVDTAGSFDVTYDIKVDSVDQGNNVNDLLNDPNTMNTIVEDIKTTQKINPLYSKVRVDVIAPTPRSGRSGRSGRSSDPCAPLGGVAPVGTGSDAPRCCPAACGGKCGASNCNHGTDCCSGDAQGRVCGIDSPPCWFLDCGQYGGVISLGGDGRCCPLACGDLCGTPSCHLGSGCCSGDANGRTCGKADPPCWAVSAGSVALIDIITMGSAIQSEFEFQQGGNTVVVGVDSYFYPPPMLDFGFSYHDRHYSVTFAAAEKLTCLTTGFGPTQNYWDQTVDFTCPWGYALSGVGATSYDEKYYDRQFKFSCCQVKGYKLGYSTQTGTLNGMRESFNFRCARNEVMTGWYSTHKNGSGNEDRSHRFKCAPLTEE